MHACRITSEQENTALFAWHDHVDYNAVDWTIWWTSFIERCTRTSQCFSFAMVRLLIKYQRSANVAWLCCLSLTVVYLSWDQDKHWVLLTDEQRNDLISLMLRMLLCIMAMMDLHLTWFMHSTFNNCFDGCECGSLKHNNNNIISERFSGASFVRGLWTWKPQSQQSRIPPSMAGLRSLLIHTFTDRLLRDKLNLKFVHFQMELGIFPKLHLEENELEIGFVPKCAIWECHGVSIHGCFVLSDPFSISDYE